jgi:hypothetical protein
LLRAVADAIDALGPARTARVDAISPASMSPSWVAIDSRHGQAPRAVTPIVTHQDRRAALPKSARNRAPRRPHTPPAARGQPAVPRRHQLDDVLWFAAHERAPTLRARPCVGHVTTLLHATLCWP